MHVQIITSRIDPPKRLILSFVAVLLLGILPFKAPAQTVLDKVVAIVGEDIILKSDIDNQYSYFLVNGEKDDGTLWCRILEKVMIEKLLLNKARQDSVEVNDERVEAQLNNRIDIFGERAGGYDKLEELYQKPLIEIKEDLRPEIRNQMMAEQMRQTIITKINVTPREVKKFYNEIPKDSLPLLPAEIELHHIVVKPTPSDEAIEDARKKLRNIRNDITNNSLSFEEAAKKYSDDLGSARVGGKLGTFGRGKMVPAFEEVAFKMAEGEISNVFKSQYGFHIIQLDKRLGEQVTASHILISPRVGLDDDELARKKLEDIREEIDNGVLSFEAAAIKYSDDESTKSNGGAIKNPQTGERRIPLDLLDADFYFKVEDLKEGSMTPVEEWIGPDRKKNYHILFLNRRVPPHVASLEEDYQKLKNAALSTKQSIEMERWFDLARKNVYIEIKTEECLETLINWIQ